MYLSKNFFVLVVLVVFLNACGGKYGNTQLFQDRRDEAKRDADMSFPFQFNTFASSPHSLQTFKNRLQEAENDSDSYWYTLQYARSTHSLQTFKNRLDEARNDSYLSSYNNSNYYRDYARSTHSLQTFKNRLQEAENDSDLVPSYYGDYAASTHSLQTFKNRFDKAVKNGIEPDDRVYFAGSNY
jgi:hypothetical protein